VLLFHTIFSESVMRFGEWKSSTESSISRGRHSSSYIVDLTTKNIERKTQKAINNRTLPRNSVTIHRRDLHTSYTIYIYELHISIILFESDIFTQKKNETHKSSEIKGKNEKWNILCNGIPYFFLHELQYMHPKRQKMYYLDLPQPMEHHAE